MSISFSSRPRFEVSSIAVNISPTMPMRRGSAGLSTSSSRMAPLKRANAWSMSDFDAEAQKSSARASQMRLASPRCTSKPACAM